MSRSTKGDKPGDLLITKTSLSGYAYIYLGYYTGAFQTSDGRYLTDGHLYLRIGYSQLRSNWTPEYVYKCILENLNLPKLEALQVIHYLMHPKKNVYTIRNYDLTPVINQIQVVYGLRRLN